MFTQVLPGGGGARVLWVALRVVWAHRFEPISTIGQYVLVRSVMRRNNPSIQQMSSVLAYQKRLDTRCSGCCCGFKSCRQMDSLLVNLLSCEVQALADHHWLDRSIDSVGLVWRGRVAVPCACFHVAVAET
jgi:hypothetical protein